MTFYTPNSEITKIISQVRSNYFSLTTHSLSFRKQQLWSFLKMMKDNQVEIQHALYEDLRKNEHEAMITEIAFVNNEVGDALDNLDEWAKNEYPETDLAFKMDKAYIRKEPFGVALVIGAWNYPIQLTLVPFIAALAAGNAVILKPSELSTATAALLAQLIPRYLDERFYRVINGGPEETTLILQQKFDYIFYTGSTVVGKIIMEAAAKHLTPVTLELGGKSPCFVFDDCDLEVTARRICWGKFLNVGQTCIAPDYIICTPEMQPKLVKELAKVIAEFYSDNPANSNDYGRIVNSRHLHRIRKYIQAIDKSKVAFGGIVHEDDLYISPTILTDVKESDLVMQDEIFGPILPIMTFNDMKEGIEFARKRDQPLALYLFSSDSKTAETVVRKITSGSVCVNDTCIQVGLPTLPFGGVGPSGMGAYHGKFGFDTFSHKRAILHRSFALDQLNTLRNPPLTARKMSWLALLLFKAPRKSSVLGLFRLFSAKHLMTALCAALLVANIYLFQRAKF